MAEQEPYETQVTETEPQFTSLRERHEAAKAQLRAEMDADMEAVKSMSNEELEAMRIKANRKLKPLPADVPAENLNALRLMLDLMRDPSITVV